MPWNLFSQLPWTLRELLSFLSPFISCFSFQSAIFALQTLTECNALCPESISSGICSRSICSFISLITIVITKIFVQLLIDFRNWKCQLFSCAWLFVIPWTVPRQAPLSMEFSRQEDWSGLPFPSPGDLSDPGAESQSLNKTKTSFSHMSWYKHPWADVATPWCYPSRLFRSLLYHPLECCFYLSDVRELMGSSIFL